MTARQANFGTARQGAVPADRGRQRITQNFAMPCAANPIAEHPGKWQIRLKGRQTMGHGAKGLGHGRAIDHRQHRYAEVSCQISRRGRTIEQAHHPFDQNQIGFTCRLPKQPAALRLANHPQIKLIHRCTAGASENHRIEKIRAAFEHPHALALARVQPCQGSGYGGLALAGSRCSDQQCRTLACGHQYSTPFCAFTPALKACLTRLISVTVSAASIIPGSAPRPVTTTCCSNGRASISASTASSSR